MIGKQQKTWKYIYRKETISNEKYNADNHDLDILENNNSFKNFLLENIKIDEFQDDNNQKECADYVWSLYKKW